MVQRSLIMIIFQEFCDGLFYFSFSNCYDNERVAAMSDNYDTIIKKLIDLEWRSITAVEFLPTAPTEFYNERIDIIDKRMSGMHSSINETIGIITSLKKNGE